MKREVPEPWASAMKTAGVVDKRWGNPSWSELGREVKVHPSTLIAMADGTRVTDVETVAKVADRLRVTTQEVGQWIGERRTVGDLYRPPEESRYLSDDEKNALTAFIKAIADSKVSDGDAAPAAQKSLTVVPDLPASEDARGPDPQMTDAEAAQTEAGPSEGQLRKDQQDKDAQTEGQ